VSPRSRLLFKSGILDRNAIGTKARGVTKEGVIL
jgi:hypothetical protein